MLRRSARTMLLLLTAVCGFGQATQHPGDPQSAPKVDAQNLPAPAAEDSSSRPPLPLPPDAQLPPGAPTSTQPKRQSVVKRKLRQLAPECATAFFKGVCWATHPVPPPSTLAASEQAAAKAIEVGDYYYSQKNYHAAESRFREALGYMPENPAARFKLAQSLEKLGRTDEARASYQSYLEVAPAGPFAESAKKSLAILASNSKSETKKKP